MNKFACVAGAGTMGNGIVHVFALAGWRVLMVDTSSESLERGLAAIAKNMDRQVKKEAISEADRVAALERITTANSLELASEASVLVEAILEVEDVKKDFFRRADEILNPNAIFGSNTSSISITRIASATKRPDKFIGMHFMNPVPMMKLVEVIRGYSTSDETTKAIMDLSRELGKDPVEVNDYPGFVSNRVLMPMINEAIFCLHEGVATRDAIDTVMKLGMAHPMGPLQLADFIGLDVCLNILNVLYDGFNDPKYRACPLLKNMVAAGKLGRKSGSGFYDYSKG